MAQGVNRNELVHTLITMREQELASFKAYLETADLSLLAGLVQQPPSEEDIGAYKYYIYNNPWHNQLILKSKHWREWVDKNPIYSNLFSEIKVTGDTTGKPITILPTGINLSTPTWDPTSGALPPPNVDWKAIFTNFKLEVDRLNDRIKSLTLEREQGGKSVDFLISQNEKLLRDKDKIINGLLKDGATFKEAYVKLQQTFAENSANLASVEKQQIAQLTKDLSEANTKLVQIQASSGAQISSFVKEVATKDQTVLDLQHKVELVKEQLGSKGLEIAKLEQHYDNIIDNLRITHKIEVDSLKADGGELQNKLINLENHVKEWTTADMESHGNAGLETVEEMRIALAGLQPWFENANLPKTWEFVEDAYKELMAIQSKLSPETINPTSEAAIRRKIEWEQIQNYFLTVLTNIGSAIPFTDDIKENHNKIMEDDLKNDSNSTINRLKNLRDYLVNSWPEYLHGKNKKNLDKLHRWEAYEGLSDRTPMPLPPKKEEIKPENTKLPDSGTITPIDSGQQTPIFPSDFFGDSNINTQPNSEVPTPNLFRNRPEVDEELQQKKDDLEEKIKFRLTSYTLFSSIKENTILPAKFRKYPSLSMTLSRKFGEDARWELLLDAVNEYDSWEIEEKEGGVVGYKEVEYRLIKALTEIVVERLILLNNVEGLKEYMEKNDGWIEERVYGHNRSNLNAFLLKDTVAQIRLLMDKLTTEIKDGVENEHYQKMKTWLANSKTDYYTMLMHFRTFVRQRKRLLENVELLPKLNYWESVEKVPSTQAIVYDWKKVLDEVKIYLDNNPTDGFKEIRKWIKVKFTETGNPMEEIDLDDVNLSSFTNYVKDETAEQQIKGFKKKDVWSLWLENFTPLKAVNDENSYLNSLAVFLTGRQDVDVSAGQLYSQQNVATRLRVALCYILMYDKVLQLRYKGDVNKFRMDLLALATREYTLDADVKWFEILALLLRRPIAIVGDGHYEEVSSYSGLPTLNYTRSFMIIEKKEFLGSYYAPLVRKLTHKEGIFELKVNIIVANDAQNSFVFEFERPLKMLNFDANIEEQLISENIENSNKLRLICGNDNKERYEKIKTDLEGMKKGIIAIYIGNAIPGSTGNLKIGLVDSEIIIQPNCFITVKRKQKPHLFHTLDDLLNNEFPDKSITEMYLTDDFFEKANVYSDGVLNFGLYPKLEKIEYVLNNELKENLRKQLEAQTKLDERTWDTSWEKEEGVRDNLERLTKEINDYVEKNKKCKIKKINVDGNKELRTLIFPFAKLGNLSITNNKKLKKLDVSYNRITDVATTILFGIHPETVDDDRELEELNISHNRLGKLYLNEFGKIKKINVSYNNLTILKLYNQPELIPGGLKGVFGTEFNALGRTPLNDSEIKYIKARRGLCPQNDDGLAVAVVDVQYPERERERET